MHGIRTSNESRRRTSHTLRGKNQKVHPSFSQRGRHDYETFDGKRFGCHGPNQRGNLTKFCQKNLNQSEHFLALTIFDF